MSNQNWLVKTKPLLDTIPFGTPKLQIITSRKRFASVAASQRLVVGMYFVIFVYLSTMTSIKSKTSLWYLLGGRSVMKSIESSSYGPASAGSAAITL